MKNSWYSISKFLFEKEKENEEKFKTYLSPYLVPKAYRIASDELAKAVIEFKYVDVSEGTKKVAHPDSHRIYFEVGDKTKRIYKVYISATPKICDHSAQTCLNDLDEAFINLSQQLKNTSTDKYVATLAATKQCLSNMSITQRTR